MAQHLNPAPSDFRAFYDGLPVAVALLDSSFRFTDLNTAFELEFDYARTDIASRGFAHIFDENRASDLLMAIARMRNGDAPREVVDCQIRNRNNEVIGVTVHLSHLNQGDGSGYIAMVQKIGRTRERERLLLSQAEMFRVTIDQSPLPMSIQDNNFRFVMVNQAYTQLTGYSEHDLIGRDAADFLHPSESRENVRQERHLVHNQGIGDLNRFSMRRQLVHRNGRRVPYRMEIGRSRGLDGQPLWVAVLIDLSKLEQAQAGQTALLASVEAGVAHVVDGVIAQVNPALTSLVQRDYADLIGRPASILFANNSAWAQLEAGLANGVDTAASRLKQRLELSTYGETRAKKRCEVFVRHVDPAYHEHGLLLTVNDIGDLLDQSDRLQHSVSELESVLDTEPVGIAQLSSGHIVRANRKLAELLGQTVDELLGREFTDFCNADAALFESNLGGSPPASGSNDVVIRTQMRCANGKRPTCLIHISAPDTDRDELVVVVLDLAQQLSALDYASRMQLRFDAFSAMLDQSVVIINTQSDRIEHANAATFSVLGLKPSTLLGDRSDGLWTNLLRGSQARAKRALGKAVEGETGALIVERENSPARQSIRLRFYVSDDAREVYLLAEDVTSERQDQERRIADAVEQQEALVREVQHRIKNNLQGVAGLLEQTALDEPGLTEPVRTLAAKIQTIAHVHGMQIHPGQSVAAEKLVDAVAKSLGRTMNIAIETHFETRIEPGEQLLGIAEADTIPIALMINELITNAGKHRVGASPVTVEVIDKGRQVSITVSNQGQLPTPDPLADASAVRGMGLIRALLPRKGAGLRIRNANENQVAAELTLLEPLLCPILDTVNP